MTLLKPTITINRLLVSKGGISVMDITFHAGLNIIVGENSSGKTTAVRFVAYAMGAENIGFSQVAQACDDVYLEVCVNAAVMTLHRKVSVQPMQAMSIYWGRLEDAFVSGPSLWQLFPFKRSDSKESFSQVLFRSLEMPELRGEGGSNITMHQILRLVYSDQETPSSDIFRYDRFDRGITRAAIGDYLLGVDSTELYELKLKEAALDKEVSSIKTSIRTIYNTFGQAGAKVSVEFIDNQIQSVDSEINSLNLKLQSMQHDETKKASSSKLDEALRKRLNESHKSLSELRQKKLTLDSEIADSQLFIQELEYRLLSLEESAIAESYLGGAAFTFCPSCFSKIEPQEEEESDSCALCKSKVTSDSARTQLARMRNELHLQIRESETIRKQQLDTLDAIVRDLPQVEMELKSAEAEYYKNKSMWVSPNQLALQQVSREIGSKEQELKNLLELKKVADLVDKLSINLSKLEADLDWVQGRIQAVVREQETRRDSAYRSVSNNLISTLKRDLFRQAEFANADSVSIDFGGNQLTIGDQRQFSASSMVFLRHAFHLALLQSSLNNAYFRYPRLLILDGIEDGGMEVERSYNFQKIISDISRQTNTPHQIIMTTMNISPELDNDTYTVGRKYTHQNKSIGLH